LPAEAVPVPLPVMDAVEIAQVSELPAAPAKQELAAHIALPQTPMIRVRVQYASGDAESTARAGRQADRLRAAGFVVEAPSPLARGGAQPGIRYFFAEDRDAAAEVARRLESFAGDIRQAAPVRRDALPRPGTVEVLLPAR